MNNIVIRKPKSSEEISQVREIIEESFPEWHAYYAIKGLRNHRLLLAVDESNNLVVGFIQYKVVQSGNVKIGHMYYMAVRPEYRGQGIGTELVKSCEKELIENNVDVIIASTQERNVPVLKIFTNLGYMKTDWTTATRILKRLGADIEDEYDLMWLIYDYDEVVLLKVVKHGDNVVTSRSSRRSEG